MNFSTIMYRALEELAGYVGYWMGFTTDGNTNMETPGFGVDNRSRTVIVF